MRYIENAPAWVEQYRPRTIEDCILPEALKATFQSFVTAGGMNTHLLFHGPAGSGKSTVARALCNELEIYPLFVNASEDGHIDNLRTNIRDYCSTRSFDGGRKCVILDEADALTSATQAALRAFTEEFSGNVSFILTANSLAKIIEPLHSRNAVIEFKIPKAEVPALAKQCLKLTKRILTRENVPFDEKVLVEVIKRHFPDFRRIINQLQWHASRGGIDAGMLTQVKDVSTSELVQALRAADFVAVRRWCATNAEGDSGRVLRKLYQEIYDYVVPASIPEVVLIIGEYLHRAVFTQDHEINLAACLTQIMMTAEMKG